MELQDEFQFKPINEGLGFHKKKSVIRLDLDEDVSHKELPTQSNINKVPLKNQYKQNSSFHDVFQQKDKKEVPYIADPCIQFDSEIDRNAFDETQRIIAGQSDNDIFPSHSHLSFEPSKGLTQVLGDSQVAQNTISKESVAAVVQNNSSQQYPNQLSSLSNNSHLSPDLVAQVPSSHPHSTYPNNTTYQTDLNSKKMESHQVSENVRLPSQNLAPHFGAWLLDLFVMVGLVLICIIPLLLITELSVSYILTNIQTDLALQMSLAILFLAVLNFYLITTRNFFGATLGEWSFDIALGDAQKRQSPIYPILVAWRCLLMNVTGIVTLPFLGWVTRTDILGKLTSTRLTRSF